MNAPAELMGVMGLHVPGTIAYRHLAIRLVSTACKMACDASEPTFEAEVVSAFGEAFNNVAVHGHRGLAPASVQIEIDWDDDKLTITMIDSGHTFDPNEVAPPNLDELPERGMGWFIMTSCMDDVDYRPGPPNVLRMAKLRRGRDRLRSPSPEGGPITGSGVNDESPHAEPKDGDRSSGVAVIDALDHADARGARRKA